MYELEISYKLQVASCKKKMVLRYIVWVKEILK